MSTDRSMRAVPLLVALWVAGQGTGGAQTLGQEAQAPLSDGAVVVTMAPGQNADDRVQNGFGTADEHISTVSWASFLPYITAGVEYASDLTGGGRWNTAGSSFLYAAVPDDVPNGADITQIVFYVQDSNAANDFTGRLCRYYTESGLGGTPASDCPFSVSTTGSAGNGVAFGDPNVVMQRRVDLTGDGPIEVINWVLHHNQVLALDGTIRIRQVRILWRRQISPAPAAASFTDVPTTHPQFRFVEALVAANITGGCGGTLYCPDAPLTRGQMAVFLSSALGLHWPAF